MRPGEEAPERLREAHERQELLREDVARADVERRAVSAAVVVVAVRQLAEVAVGHGAELVVVVEDDPAVPRHPEVLDEEVPRERCSSRARSRRARPKSRTASRTCSSGASRMKRFSGATRRSV